jgi:hypothetical protein
MTQTNQTNSEQHYRIFLPGLLNHYRDGDLTAKGALRIYFRLRLAEGWKCRIKPAQIRSFFSKWSDKAGEMKEMPKSSFWKAMHELQEEEEIDFKEPESLVVRLFNTNQAQPSKIMDEVHNYGQGSKFGTKFKIMDEDELEVLQDNGSSFSSDSSQISYKSSSNCVYSANSEISEITHTEILRNAEEEELPGNSERVGQIVNISTVKNEISAKDQFSGQANTAIKYDSRLGMRPPAPKPKYLIPDGDWLNPQGQLDPAFIRHTAKQWQKSSNASFHQLPIEEVEALVFSHFAKNHDALAVKWEAFTKTSTRHAEAVKLRLDAGINIPEAERLEIIGKTQAIASNKTSPPEQLTIGSECTQNHQAYRLIEAAPISEDEQRQNLKKLASLRAAIGRPMPADETRKIPKLWPEDLAEANQWIFDPALKSQAFLWAKNKGFSFDPVNQEFYQQEF